MFFHRIGDTDVAVPGAWNRALNQDQAPFRIGADDHQVLGGDGDVAHLAGHLLALEYLARVLALAGGPLGTVTDRNPMGSPKPGKTMPFYDAGEALADGGAGHVDELAGDEMGRR